MTIQSLFTADPYIGDVIEGRNRADEYGDEDSGGSDLHELASLTLSLHEREHDRPALYCHPACSKARGILR